ncbi:hypothetical protein WN943_024040 [Citrus x changshan-huyou]
MITPKKLMKLAKKWQKLAASKRLRISLPRPTAGAADAESCSTSSTAEKGHFVVHTTDQIRFVIPLKYLENNIIRELFRIAEDEFGMPGSGPITLPCDAIVMNKFIGNMISTKKLIKLARKWQKLAAIRQKRIMSTIFKGDDAEKCYVKGHFIVYTVDHKRFVLPLVYLNNNVVQALLELAEEFGLPTNGPLTVLCDTAFMEYVVTLISHNVNEDAERPLLTLIAGSHRASSS